MSKGISRRFGGTDVDVVRTSDGDVALRLTSSDSSVVVGMGESDAENLGKTILAAARGEDPFEEAAHD